MLKLQLNNNPKIKSKLLNHPFYVLKQPHTPIIGGKLGLVLR